jgi:hypothetical protein
MAPKPAKAAAPKTNPAAGTPAGQVPVPFATPVTADPSILPGGEQTRLPTDTTESGLPIQPAPKAVTAGHTTLPLNPSTLPGGEPSGTLQAKAPKPPLAPGSKISTSPGGELSSHALAADQNEQDQADQQQEQTGTEEEEAEEEEVEEQTDSEQGDKTKDKGEEQLDTPEQIRTHSHKH